MQASAHRHQRLRAVFEAALGRDPSTRDSYLDDACDGDAELRRQVIRLLAAHGSSSSFLERPVPLPAFGIHAERDLDFRGTGRFNVLRQLGVGGMGVVYEVHDRIRDEVVALKTLRRDSAADVYRLKREFRSLVDVAHVNLVCLHELFVEADQCFFTMELVKGVNFVDYVRGGSQTLRSHDRLIAAFRQLVGGISELHRSRKLHRDIKPSNILVTSEGRVVLLDFGLITELLPESASRAESLFGGTPAYMSPEEGSGMAVSEASDWYSAGVTLYEALTGDVPFSGPFFEVLRRKRELDPPSPANIVPDVPEDLCAICMGLLCRDPERRLSGAEALRRLSHGSIATSEPASTPLGDTPFVGRDRQLDVLNDAFQALKQDRPAAVCVCGPSGIGKSALIRHFLGQLKARDEAVVLSGRCYERESVPYKALDGVVDSLTRYLRDLPRATAERLLPADTRALSRLFPALLQVNAITDAVRSPEQEIEDPLVQRRRAWSALRELLNRIAERQPFVMYIDDLHWADTDSAMLLEELLRPPHSPPLLTVVCFRSEDFASKPFLQTLLERAGNAWSVLQLEPMSDDEACELVGSLMPANSPLNDVERRRIAQEASGNPFFLEQLAHYVAVNEIGSEDRPTFAEMFEGSVRRLPVGARPFLETLAICGRPMAPAIVSEASGLEGDTRPLLAMLRSTHFIRSSGSSDQIETYHDRIREALAARLSSESVRQIHGRLIQTLVARRSDDHEALFEHYRGVGDDERAAIQAGASAEKARAGLAFDRAAAFFRHALNLAPDSAACLDWKRGLAGALANAGRPADAAEAYLEAAKGASPPERVELQRRGAEQLLIGGHIDHGLDVIRTVLDAVGMRLARGPRTALASLVWRRAQLRWRGWDFSERAPGQVASDKLLRIDTCWSIMTGLALVDMIRAADFSARHLLLALDAGEPYRIARALAIEAVFAALPGGASRRRASDLVQRSHAMSEGVGHPHVIALSALAVGMAALGIGQWKKASIHCEKALGILRDRCQGVTWEINCAQNFLLGALLYQGELREVSGQLPALLAGAQSCGNLYFETELCTRMNLVWLAADQPDEGERQALQSIERWSHKGFHRQHYSGLLARVQTELYRGTAENAWRLMTDYRPMLSRTLLLRAQVIRVEASYLHARCALAMAAHRKHASRHLSIARAAGRRIARERMPWSDPVALLVSAAVAYLERDTPLSTRHLGDAVDGFDLADMKLYAAAARRRLGTLVGGARGAEMLRQADEWMAAQNIKNPAHMTRMLAPGLPDAP